MEVVVVDGDDDGSGLVHVIRPNLINPVLNPRNMRSIAYAPRMVVGPLLNNPTNDRTLSDDRITAFQNGAITYDQSSRFKSVAPFCSNRST